MSFSKRTEWNQELNDLHTALSTITAGGKDVLDLTESNPTRCGFTYPAAWMTALADPKALTYEPDALGLMSARQSVAQYNHVDVSRVMLTASTSESYQFLFRLLLDPGDHVLIPRPSYPLFQFLLQLSDAEYDAYDLVYDQRWSLDMECLEKLVTPKTKVLVLVNPNNPTGSYLTEEELFMVNLFCQRHHMSIISDEVFFEYRLKGGNFVSLKDNEPVLTFVLGGLSKALALPQMKCGWMITSGPAALCADALQRLEIIADTFLSVNTPVQHALSTWLPQAKHIQNQILERVLRNYRALRQSGLDVLNVEGGWYALIRTPFQDEEDLVLKLLKDHCLLVHPGFFFDIQEPGLVVVSLLPKSEAFDKLISVLKH